MSKRVEFFLRAAPGLCHRRLVINRYPGAGESVGAPVVDVTLDADEVSFGCSLPENKMWQALLVDSKPSGTRSTHATVFNTATNRRVDPKDEAHSGTLRLSSIQEETDTPAPAEPVAADSPPVLPVPASEPPADTEDAENPAVVDEAVESAVTVSTGDPIDEDADSSHEGIESDDENVDIGDDDAPSDI
jgi:hypothetical protein